MGYFLVLLSDAPGGVPASTSERHEQFIDSLIAGNTVLLGGGFTSRVNGLSAGYVLVADDIDAATAIAHGDPLVRDVHATCAVTEWCLVGINTAAIDPTKALER